MLYVSRDAKLTLMYQIEAVWHSTSVRLENINSSHEMLSHAAMGEETDHLMLVTHDLARGFRLYKITINWHASQQTRPNGPPYTAVSPTFEVGHLTVIEHVRAQQADAARLSDLRLIPAIPTIADATALTYPTILAIFTHATLPADPTQQRQEPFSVIARWHVESVVPALHESFAKLKVNGTTPAQSPVTVLRRQEDVFTGKLILSVVSQYHNTILAFGASDGTIEFRDRITMTSIEWDGDTTTVSSLPQAGFEQMMGDHNIHTVMSPDGSALASVKPDSTLAIKMMALRYGWQPLEDGISDPRGLIEAAVVCLARQYSILCCSNTSNDESLALVPNDLSTELRTLFIREVTKITNRTLDMSMQDANRQQMMAIREPLLSRALSAQFVLLNSPSTMERDFSGKVAYAFLNMRLACTALMTVAARPQNQVPVPPGVYTSLRGQVAWGSDLLVYITENLIYAERRFHQGAGLSAQQAISSFISQRDNPAIHLLLNTFTRTYIRMLSSFIPKFLTFVQKEMSNARSVQERQQLEEAFQRGTSLPFKYLNFDAFMADIDTALRNTYTTNSIPADRRAEIELSLLTEPTIPDELQPALHHLLHTSLPNFIPNVDVSALYFRDTTWLGIEQSNARQYDIITKQPITKGVNLRVCRRCGAVMEDPSQEKVRELPHWFTHAQRHCVCGNYWNFD